MSNFPHKKRGRPRKNIQEFDIEPIVNVDTNIYVCFNISFEDYQNYIDNKLYEVQDTKSEDTQSINSQNSIICNPVDNHIQIKTENINLIKLDREIIDKYCKVHIEQLDKKQCPLEMSNDLQANKPTNLCCLWDSCKIKGVPVFLPFKYLGGVFYVKLWFCSLNCACAYNIRLNDSDTSNRYSLLKMMYNHYNNIDPAPSILKLKKYGGKMSIEEYRQKYCIDKPEKIEEKVNVVNEGE